MSRSDDDLIEQAAKRLATPDPNREQTLSIDTPTGDMPHDEFAANAIHRLNQRVIELEATNTALLNALTRYRANEDQMLRPEERPCQCEMCRQADEAITAAKGGA